jgi:hypothetical protein
MDTHGVFLFYGQDRVVDLVNTMLHSIGRLQFGLDSHRTWMLARDMDKPVTGIQVCITIKRITLYPVSQVPEEVGYEPPSTARWAHQRQLF